MQDDCGLIDSFGREISYVRLSVTDRCDLRCRYCMAEHMSFEPTSKLLTISEMIALADLFIARGVNRFRLTGGEPLVRRGVMDLVCALGERIGSGLDEVTLTTNGSQLRNHAQALRTAGMRRINVSLDTRDAERFRFVTRRGDLSQVLRGIASARDAGLKVKINMVGLNGVNDHEIEDMLLWCDKEGHDLTLIETMPLGEVEEDRSNHYLPLDGVRRDLEQRYKLTPSFHRTAGPARYFDVAGLRARLGFITPLTNNFCNGCNRIRVAATGTVYGCLGQDQKVELRDLLRSGERDHVHRALDQLMAGKPKGHEFHIGAGVPAVSRHMSVTGG
jgi:cyclic pyranopterin phosphate synthase